MTQDRQLAGNRNLGTMAAPFQLFAGEAEVITDSAPALAAVTKYQVLALTNTGVTPFVAGTHTGQQAVISAVDQATVGGTVPYYQSGRFIAAALIWPATINTLALQKALLIGSGLSLGHTV